MVNMDQSNGHITTTQYSISDLIFAEYNPRELTKDQHQDLKDSITRFGLVDPLIVNIHKERKNILVGGHQRLKIAKELGYKSVSCVEVELTPEKERELNIRLNKNTGQWDWDALANHFDVGELTEWGFTNDDLQFYVDEPLPGLIDEDAIPEVEEAVTQAGDMWILGEHRVLCGDGTVKSNVKQLLNGQDIDLILTDPPYCSGGFQESGKAVGSVGSTSNKKIIVNDRLSTRGYSALLKSVFGNIKSNFIYSFTDWRMWVYLFDIFESSTYSVKSMIVWDKGNPGMGRGWRAQHEIIMWGCNITPPYDRKYGGAGNVIQTKRTGNNFHTTEKPVELLEKLIINTPFVKTIADPFLGSGSTLIACTKTNRKCYGMEIDPHYCDVIVKRWEEYTGNKAERIEAASA
jgi:DNA modification methylase